MVAHEYAKAIYDLAREENKTKDFKDCFDALVKTLNKDFLDLLSSPFIVKDEKKEMVKKVYSSLDEDFIYFLYVLIDHNRFMLVEEIKKEFDKLVSKYQNIVEVKLVSATELTKATILKYKERLEEKYIGKTIEIVNIIKPELIGGMQVIIDDEALDASVIHTLNMLKESI